MVAPWGRQPKGHAGGGGGPQCHSTASAFPRLCTCEPAPICQALTPSSTKAVQQSSRPLHTIPKQPGTHKTHQRTTHGANKLELALHSISRAPRDTRTRKNPHPPTPMPPNLHSTNAASRLRGAPKTLFLLAAPRFRVCRRGGSPAFQSKPGWVRGRVGKWAQQTPQLTQAQGITGTHHGIEAKPSKGFLHTGLRVVWQWHAKQGAPIDGGLRTNARALHSNTPPQHRVRQRCHRHAAQGLRLPTNNTSPLSCQAPATAPWSSSCT